MGRGMFVLAYLVLVWSIIPVLIRRAIYDSLICLSPSGLLFATPHAHASVQADDEIPLATISSSNSPPQILTSSEDLSESLRPCIPTDTPQSNQEDAPTMGIKEMLSPSPIACTSRNLRGRWMSFRVRAPGYNPVVNLVAFSFPLLFHAYLFLILIFFVNGVLERVAFGPESIMAAILLLACIVPILALVR